MRLIDADRLKAEIKGWYVALDDREIVLQAIEESPTIDTVSVVHGRWIKSGNLTKCSICGNPAIYTISGRLDITAYCSNCGAKMEVE